MKAFLVVIPILPIVLLRYVKKAAIMLKYP